MSKRLLVCVTALALASLADVRPLAQAAPPLPPTFRFTPDAIGAGGTVTVTGERFSRAAIILAINTAGAPMVLAVAPTTGGAFSVTVDAPAIPGPYFMNVRDGSSGRVAINLIGTLSVLPPATPWFAFSPLAVAPGDSVSVLAGGFPPGTVAAAFGVVDGSGTPIVFGIPRVTGGGFVRALPVPATLAAGAYNAFLRGGGRLGVNLAGPLAVAAGPPPPEVAVGFYPIGAAADAAGRAWIPNGGDNTVSVLDGVNGAVTATVPVGELPCAIARSATSGLVFVANVNTKDVSVIDGATNAVVATVPVGDFPCAAAWLPGRAFIGNYGSNTVSVIDEATLAVVATIPSGRGPFGMGANPATGRFYVANGYDGTLSVMDGATLATIATIPVGRDPDAVGVNPLTNRVYVGNYLSASVSVIDGATNAVIATVAVGREPSAVAVNPATGHVFVANYSSNSVSVIDGATNVVMATIPTGVTPDGLAVDGAGRVYVVNSNSNSVSIIDDSPGVLIP
ncbi:MAG TPA: YncE family protein [Vicinamibacterales bacterium]